MNLEVFSEWYAAQSGVIQEWVIKGPFVLLVLAIGAALGGSVRMLLLSMRFGPTLGVGIEAFIKDAEGQREDGWVDDANGAIDDAIQKHRFPERR